MKRSEAAELVMLLLGAFPNAKTSQSTSKIYEEMLSDLDAGHARAAVQKLIASSKWMPTVAEIRGACADLERGPLRSGADAWLDVIQQIRKEGYCGEPKFEDAVVASLVERWGWRTLCFGDGVSDRARFIEAYDSLARQARDRQVSGMALPVARERPKLKVGT